MAQVTDVGHATDADISLRRLRVSRAVGGRRSLLSFCDVQVLPRMRYPPSQPHISTHAVYICTYILEHVQSVVSSIILVGIG